MLIRGRRSDYQNVSTLGTKINISFRKKFYSDSPKGISEIYDSIMDAVYDESVSEVYRELLSSTAKELRDSLLYSTHVHVFNGSFDTMTLLGHAVRTAMRSIEGSGIPVGSVREQMRPGLADAVKATTDIEGSEQFRLQKTQDHREGIKAAAERRVGNFTNT